MAEQAAHERDKMANESRTGINDKETENGQKKLVNEAKYDTFLTVNIELLGDVTIPAYEVIQSARLLCGGLLACRSIAARKYELTMSNVKGKERLLEGFKIGETAVVASEISNDEMVVSFLNLPAYVEDGEILAKLSGWGVQAVSQIRRRMWPGTRIADGTRFLKVKFNERVQSLPYSTKFNTALGAEYFRVIHDKQVKVCRLCIQPGHILRECPEFTCHRCGVQGHFVRECSVNVKKCKVCYNVMEKCICNHSEEESQELFENSEMEEESGSGGETGDEGEQRGEGEKELEQVAPTPQGAVDEIGSSLDGNSGLISASRHEAREEGKAPSELTPLPQRPAEGSRTATKSSRMKESVSPAAEHEMDEAETRIDCHSSSQNSDNDMDLTTLVSAHTRLRSKLALKKAKRKEKEKESKNK